MTFKFIFFRSKYLTRDNIVDYEKKTRNINAQVLQPPVLWTGCCNCCIVVETEATVPKYHICYETVTYTWYVQVQY